MYESIIKKFKINSRMLVFILLIVFVIFSFTTKQKDDKKNVFELLSFLDKTFSTIDNTFNNLSNQTLIFPNVKENYELVVDSLSKLKQDIIDFEKSIPNQTGEELYQNVRSDLIEIYKVSYNRINLSIEIYNVRKNLITNVNNYYKLADINSLSSNKELEEIIESWKTVISFKKLEAKQNDSNEIKKYYYDKIEKEEDLLTKLSLSSSNSNTLVIDNDLKENIKKLQIERYDSFLRLQIENLENPDFGEKVKKLQNSVKQLKNS